jgi:hypothetical protein
LPEYVEFHKGECDMKICDVPLSQKKINGKSNIALDWWLKKTALLYLTVLGIEQQKLLFMIKNTLILW